MVDKILLEDGDSLLLEDGEFLLKESESGSTFTPIKFLQQRKIIRSGVYRSHTYQIPSIRYGLFEEAEGITFKPFWISNTATRIIT